VREPGRRGGDAGAQRAGLRGRARPFVDGVQRGSVSVGSLGVGETEWGDDDGGPPLDFDPRGKVIDVSGAAGVLLSGPLAGSIPGVTTCAFSETETPLGEDDELFLDFEPVGASVEVKQGDVLFFSLTQGGPGTGGGGGDGGGSCTEGPLEVELPLLNPGVVPAASGKARYRLRDDCDRDFRVEIEDVADGSYELRVGGVARGTITVAGGEGELEFEDPVEPGKVLFDFDPRGQLVEVLSGATVVLQRPLPVASAAPQVGAPCGASRTAPFPFAARATRGRTARPRARRCRRAVRSGGARRTAWRAPASGSTVSRTARACRASGTGSTPGSRPTGPGAGATRASWSTVRRRCSSTPSSTSP
jgi:hypothetical protein